MADLRVVQGSFKKGHWLSDRDAYSDEDIAALNDVLHRLAKDIHPGWIEFIWKPKEPPQLQCVK